MSYFNQVSPEAEQLLQEIINLKTNKTDTAEYWSDCFNEKLDFNYQQAYRSLFSELKKANLINIRWGDGKPILVNLLSAGENYFEHKEIYTQEIEMNRQPMGFEYLDSESEEFLSEVLNRKEFPLVSESIVIKSLIECKYLDGFMSKPYGQDGNVTCCVDRATQKGKSYFEMKEKYENQIKTSKSNITHITTGNNSPVNLAVDGSTSTQTVDYANNEEIKALSSFADMVNSVKDFTEEERAEILELIAGAKEATSSGKKTVLKIIMSGLGTALAKAPAFIIDKWDEIQQMFGG